MIYRTALHLNVFHCHQDKDDLRKTLQILMASVFQRKVSITCVKTPHTTAVVLILIHVNLRHIDMCTLQNRVRLVHSLAAYRHILFCVAYVWRPKNGWVRQLCVTLTITAPAAQQCHKR